MGYPVTFAVDYLERRDRLTTFFRLLLAIPIAIWLALYGLAAFLAVVVAWFTLVITARFPAGLYEFVAGYVRLLTFANAYVALLVRRLPAVRGGGAGVPDPDDICRATAPVQPREGVLSAGSSRFRS